MIFWSNLYFDQFDILINFKWYAKPQNWVEVGELDGIIWHLILLSIFNLTFLSIFYLILYSNQIDILIKLLLLPFWYFYQNLMIMSKTPFSVPLKCNFALFLYLISFFTFCVSLFLFSLSQGFLALNIHIHLFYSLFLLSFFDINFLYIFISSFFFAFTFCISLFLLYLIDKHFLYFFWL